MSFWNIFGNMAASDDGTTIQKLSDTFSVSSDGVTYTTMGNFTTGSDGSSLQRWVRLAAMGVRALEIRQLAQDLSSTKKMIFERIEIHI
jgi:hypothetical protein